MLQTYPCKTTLVQCIQLACRSHMVLHCFWHCHAADVRWPAGSFWCCLIMACLSWLFKTAVQCQIPAGLWSTAALYSNNKTCPSPLSMVQFNMNGPYARPYEITLGPRIANMIKVSRSYFHHGDLYDRVSDSTTAPPVIYTVQLISDHCHTRLPWSTTVLCNILAPLFSGSTLLHYGCQQ